MWLGFAFVSNRGFQSCCYRFVGNISETAIIGKKEVPNFGGASDYVVDPSDVM